MSHKFSAVYVPFHMRWSRMAAVLARLHVFMCVREFYNISTFADAKRPIQSPLNWTILLCDVIPDGKTIERQKRRPQSCPFQSSFTQRTAQFTQGIPQFPQFTCRHRDCIFSRHSIHSADENRMIYSFSNTTSYSTFYAFLSSFRITLWPMWLANSKRQPCFIHHSHTCKKTTRIDKKLKNLMGNLCYAREHSVQFFVQFFTQLNCTV